MAGKSQRSVKYPPIQVGDVFTRLTVVELSHPDKNGQTHWLCRCKCGTEKRISALNLNRRLIKSCGCIRKETTSARSKTHGLSNTPEHATWCNMIGRCRRHDPGTIYAEKGTFVCQRWAESFEAFLEDMGPKPSPDSSIDRIDNDGNYTCGHCEDCKERDQKANCRWADWTQQMRNNSRNHRVTHDGFTGTISEWAERLDCSYSKVFWHVSHGHAPDGSQIGLESMWRNA